MQSDRDDSDPFFSKEPEIISSTGCEIYWKDGKDLTLKTLRLQKCEGPEGVAPTSGKLPSYSFFTYFSSWGVEYWMWLLIINWVFFSVKFRSQRLYYTLQKKRVIISMKILMRRSKKLKVGRRTAMKNQKKDLKRTWTQQRTAPENPGICVQL